MVKSPGIVTEMSQRGTGLETNQRGTDSETNQRGTDSEMNHRETGLEMAVGEEMSHGPEMVVVEMDMKGEMVDLNGVVTVIEMRGVEMAIDLKDAGMTDGRVVLMNQTGDQTTEALARIPEGKLYF